MGLATFLVNLSKVQKVLVVASCLYLSFADEVFQKIRDLQIYLGPKVSQICKFIWVPRYPGLPSPKQL